MNAPSKDLPAWAQDLAQRFVDAGLPNVRTMRSPEDPEHNLPAADAVACGDFLLEMIVSRDALDREDEWRVRLYEGGRVSSGTIAGPKSVEAIVNAYREGAIRVAAAQAKLMDR